MELSEVFMGSTLCNHLSWHIFRTIVAARVSTVVESKLAQLSRLTGREFRNISPVEKLPSAESSMVS